MPIQSGYPLVPIRYKIKSKDWFILNNLLLSNVYIVSMYLYQYHINTIAAGAYGAVICNMLILLYIFKKIKSYFDKNTYLTY